MARQRTAADAFFETFSRYRSSCRAVRHQQRGARASQPSIYGGVPMLGRPRLGHPGCTTHLFSSITARYDKGTKEKREGQALRDHAARSAQNFDRLLDPTPPPQIAELHQQHPQLDILGFWSMLEESVRLSHGPDDESAARALQRLMRSIPHSTVLVTASQSGRIKQARKLVKILSTRSTLSSEYKSFYGAIVSSMTSVTVGPPPIISFNLKVPSQTLDAILYKGFFTIHFLEASADGAYVAQTFLRNSGNHEKSWEALSQSHQVRNLPTYHIKDTTVSTTGIVPRIVGRGIESYLVCRVLRDKCVHNVGDHSIIVATVVGHGISPGYSQQEFGDVDGQDTEYPPLLMYSQKRFRSHGPVLEYDEAYMPDLPDHLVCKDESGAAKHPDSLSPDLVLETNSSPLYRAAHRFVGKIMAENSHRRGSPLWQALSHMHAESYSNDEAHARFSFALRLWRSRHSLSALDRTESGTDFDLAHAFLHDTHDDQVIRDVSDLLVEWSKWYRARFNQLPSSERSKAVQDRRTACDDDVARTLGPCAAGGPAADDKEKATTNATEFDEVNLEALEKVLEGLDRLKVKQQVLSKTASRLLRR